MADNLIGAYSAHVKTERYANALEAETALWDEFVILHRRAHETLDLQDGIAAGKAWGRFVRLFERPRAEYSIEEGSNVIRLGARP